ncbi:MAG: PTS sugar transporter subunit IIA [Planctomycetes bacterium]|jgi:PTS system fructose-specific IIA component/PTS system nitrogen regulatory IIA component|nr:PTS sugar transporter subunit IIA [Planctomycetota bacterium]
MKLGDFIPPGHIIAHLNAKSKEEAIAELVDSLVETGDLPAEDRDQAVLALLKREALAPTGVGNGIAIPHAQIRSVRGITGAIGVSPEGILFDGRNPAHVIFLLLSSSASPPEHLQSMALVSRLASDPRTISLIRNASTKTKIFHAVREAEERIFPPPQAF